MGQELEHRLEVLDIVVPIFRCASMLNELHGRIGAVMKRMACDYRLILVDDGDPGGAWQEICRLAAEDGRVCGLRLSRNFGQHAAISAGLSVCRQAWVVVMDGDLQDAPEDIETLARSRPGFDYVVARRDRPHESPFKLMLARLFYVIFNWLTSQRGDHAIGNFGIYSPQVIAACRNLPERHRFFPLNVRWLGFRESTVLVTQQARKSGRSSYSLWRLFQLGGATILSYSNRLLHLVIVLGLIVAGGAFGVAVALGGSYFLRGAVPSMPLAILLSLYFLSGVILTALGILGLYVGRIYDEARGRPIFIIAEEAAQNPRGNSKP